MKRKSSNNYFGVSPLLSFLAMWVTQDIVMRFFFSKKTVKGIEFLLTIKGSMILAPTHRSRWDGLFLTFALGRRVTSKDCRFMVTKSEMVGIQGWFLKRLGCFSIDQESPSLSSLRYALDLIMKNEQLVIFPEGKINKNGENIPFKQGLFRLAQIVQSKGKPVYIVPIGIAYDQINPQFGSKCCLFIEEPIDMKDFLNHSKNEFNDQLSLKINKAELKAKNILRG